MALLEMLQAAELNKQVENLAPTGWLTRTLVQVATSTTEMKELNHCLSLLEKMKFFDAPTELTLTTSRNQPLVLYSHAEFGKHAQSPGIITADLAAPMPRKRASLPALSSLIDFIQSFKETELPRLPTPQR
jgi:hypothetical protein